MKAPVSFWEQVTTLFGACLSVTDFFAEIICLDYGILGRKITMSDQRESIDHALELLTPEESLKARRKFRKLARRFSKKSSWPKMQRHQKRNVVETEVYYKAIMAIHRSDGMYENDNDEV